jgi:hypothetical protein
MRQIAYGACAALLLAGCAPVQTYYKVGASQNQLARQTTTCQVKALRDVPPSTQVRRIPPEYVPPYRSCDEAGNCTMRGGYWIPGETVTFDPNDGLRKRVEVQCMAARGYAPVSIPACPDAVAAAAPPGPSAKLPQLGPKACAIRLPGGGIRVVNRG